MYTASKHAKHGFNTVHGLNFVICWDLIKQLYIKQKKRQKRVLKDLNLCSKT